MTRRSRVKRNNPIVCSVIAIGAVWVLSRLFRFPLSNSWQALAALPFVFGSLWKWGWDYAGARKTGGALVLRFALAVMLLGYVITCVAFAAGVL